MTEDESRVDALVLAAREDLPSRAALVALRAKVGGEGGTGGTSGSDAGPEVRDVASPGLTRTVLLATAGTGVVALITAVLVGGVWLTADARRSPRSVMLATADDRGAPTHPERDAPTPSPAAPRARGPIEENVPSVRADEGLSGEAADRVPSAREPGPSTRSESRPRVDAAPVDAVERPGEIELVVRARRDVSANPRAALEALAAHRSFYPRGVLSEERDALEIQALVRLGRPSARARARAFSARYPHSVHRERVERAIASLEGDAP